MQTKVSYTVGETTNAGYLNKYLYTFVCNTLLYEGICIFCQKIFITYFYKPNSKRYSYTNANINSCCIYNLHIRLFRVGYL